MSRRAFTLVELLVVIAIIGLLSTIAIVSLNASRAKSRNTKRIADIKQIATAFTAAYIDTGSYPDTTAGGLHWACLTTSCTGGWSGITLLSNVDNFLALYMSSKPTDPPGGTKTYGGYLFNNNWGPATGPYDGTTFPAGPYIDYVVENIPGVSCGQGKIYSLGASNVECLLLLNQ